MVKSVRGVAWWRLISIVNTTGFGIRPRGGICGCVSRLVWQRSPALKVGDVILNWLSDWVKNDQEGSWLNTDSSSVSLLPDCGHKAPCCLHSSEHSPELSCCHALWTVLWNRELKPTLPQAASCQVFGRSTEKSNSDARTRFASLIKTIFIFICYDPNGSHLNVLQAIKCDDFFFQNISSPQDTMPSFTFRCQVSKTGEGLSAEMDGCGGQVRRQAAQPQTHEPDHFTVTKEGRGMLGNGEVSLERKARDCF